MNRCESCGKAGYPRDDKKSQLTGILVDIRREWDDCFRYNLPILCTSCCFDGERDHVRLNILAHRRRVKRMEAL